MKKLLLLLFMAASWISADATDWFPFEEVNHKWNIGIGGGYNPSMEAGVYNLCVTIRGFHLTIGGIGGSSHKNDVNVGKWEEKSSMLAHFGYQIPIVKAFRIIPAVGIAGAGTTTTDGYDWEISQGQINNKTYKEMSYRFDYGIHLVYNHRKLILNIGASRYAVTGCIGLEF